VDICFVSLQAREPLAYGLMSLAAALRAHGHRVSLVQGPTSAAVASHPRVRDADVLAMSATTGLHRVYLRWARELRRRFAGKAIVLGGPHPTFFPKVLEQVPLDGICLGEGEESFPEFLDLWRAGFPEIPAGWWIRRDGGRGPVERGAIRGPVSDLDSLPAPAFDLFYDAERRYGDSPNKAFLATRGCPHRCTYCFNHQLNERHRPFGKLLRAHDPERICDQILRVRDRWGMRLAWFLDANFVANQPWLEEFSRVYRRRVGLPFFCKLRPERATERTVRLLVDANCTAVGVGIESGSERLRRDVLGRPGRDADILAGCRRLKAAGLSILSFSMVGIPGASLDDELRSVALNAACRVDMGAATILQPYPGTPIAKYAQDQGLFDGDYDRLSFSYFAPSPLRYPSPRDHDRVTNLQRLFSFAVEFPEVRTRLRRLIDRQPNRLFRFVFSARHTWGITHTFYRAFERGRPVDAGTGELLRRACRDLALD
jgi:anaerobic magnesium-protoporphyrin IX monomethyl ester cyclase